MRFVSPHWLWFLAAIPVFFLFVLYDEQGREKRFSKFMQSNLWKTLAPEYDRKARIKKATIWLLALGFALVAMARPQWGTKEEVSHVSGKDVMIVLDVSNSMETEDIVPSRLKKSKRVLKTLVEGLAGDRVGVIAFAASAMVACPLTTDTEYVVETIDMQNPHLMSMQGTDIGIALETALHALDRGAEENDQNISDSAASRVVVLVTDGEDHEGRANEEAEKLKAAGIKLFVFGVGTQKGGPVPVRDEFGNLMGYKRDRAGQSVISSFQPGSLEKLAAVAGGKYWNVSMNETEVQDLLKDLGAMSRGEFAERRFLVYNERYQYPLAVAVFLFLLELSMAARTVVKTTALIAILILSGVPSAHAEPVDTYLENKKGLDAYKKGQMDEARQHFGAAQARDPDLPELRYNQGVVGLQGEDSDGAIRDFKESARDAMSKGKPDLAARSLFNLANVYSKKGDMRSAVESYMGAIQQAKQSGNQALETDSRKNLELLYQQQQKQKQQQQQKKQDQDKKDQEQKQQEQQQQQQAQNGGKDQKNDQKNDDQDQKKNQQHYDTGSSRQRKFESQKLTGEDADRVMAELKNRERELQARLKKQNGNPTNNTKDW